MSIVTVHDLTMTYRVPVREAGLRAAVGSLFRRTVRDVCAVRELSFTLDAGAVIGFIGPNGAGKTTTLKILAGVLRPTSGAVGVMGFTPWKRERGFLTQIAMVRGSRPIAGPPELTVLDTLRFQRLIYQVPRTEFHRHLDELVGTLELDSVLQRQVRALSLGERMRAGLACALVYRPRVLFLDEPTIGLDVAAVGTIRRFLADYSRTTGATILLTSHYMADVETLCKRIILIDRGRLAYDGDLTGLSERVSPYKLVRVDVPAGAQPRWDRFGELVEEEGTRVSLRVRREEVAAVTARLLAELVVGDLSVQDPPLESVMDRVYREGLEA